MLVRSALHRDARKLPLAREVENIIRRQSLANNGVWYDPSDLSTLFQDAAGTIPVTAAGQPVGLILDKSKGPALGPEIINSLDIRVAPWTALGSSAISANSFSTAGAGGFYYPLSPYKSYVITVDCQSSAAFAYYLYKIAGAATLVYSNNGKFLLSTTDATALYIRNLSAGTLTINTLSVRELPGNHATQTTAGYKPLLQSENGLNYLSFDGIDDFLVTGNIDFSSTDKIAVAAGVRKNVDLAAIVCELSTSANTYPGSFYLSSADGGLGIFGYKSLGTIGVLASTPEAYPGPMPKVVGGRSVISGDVCFVRVNSADVGQSALNQGTGNYGNYPLYIGRRGGTSAPFNGRLYGLAICGGLDDIYKLKKIEQYLAKKTGVII